MRVMQKNSKREEANVRAIVFAGTSRGARVKSCCSHRSRDDVTGEGHLKQACRILMFAICYMCYPELGLCAPCGACCAMV
jgi:hypothetical protein